MSNLIIDNLYFNLEADSIFPLEIPKDSWQCFTSYPISRPKTLFIYLIKCGEHLYVGSDPNGRRIGEHRSSLKHNRHQNNYMQNVFNKYRIENFYYYPLIQIPEEYYQYRDQIENAYIKLFDTFRDRNPSGLNLAEFASVPWLNRKLSQEHKDKISKGNRGQKRPPEFGLDLSRKLKGKYVGELSSCWGRKQTPEARARIAEAMRNRVVSEETKRKQSEKQKGRPQTERHILLVSKTYELKNPNGDIIQITNMAKFARDNNLNPDIMRKVAYGIRDEYNGWRKIDNR